MGQLWTDKYAPKNLGQIVGNSEALAKIKSWALDWQRGKKLAPLMLYGPPGVGKTATVRALAEEMGWALVETNASDLRDGQTMKKLLGAASGASTLYGGIRLVLIDEVDAALDRGQVPELNKVLTEALQPILLTANDLWEPKITPLRALCTKIEFKKVSKAEVRKRLEAVLLAENCSHDLAPYLDNAQGDVRAALLDLQAGVPGLRERQINVFEGIRRVFKAKTFKESLSAQDDSAVDLDLFLRWIEENIPAEYESAEEVADAFDKMSRADVFS
ncbi:MAG TPA: AAA family ATPase, partial [Candidatus Norongarragalinales archaeon]|nr:AAA family ATPase [Candidatus Norongarragalinales archaeon]